MIKVVTITGADESVTPGQLFDLSRKYPFVEWAILVSPKSTGNRTRFPSIDWIKKLIDVAKVTKHSEEPIKLSLHLCGGYVNDFLMGDHSNIAANLRDVWDSFTRVQINTHGELHEVDLIAMELGVSFFPEKEFIFQYDQKHDHVLDYLKGRGVKNFSALFDMSHGAGIAPDSWPELLPGIKCGYAGGISPTNIEEHIRQVNNIVGKTETWIDMETHVRSNNDRQFDLNKVEECLRKYLSTIIHNY